MAVRAKHPTGVYLQGTRVQGGSLSALRAAYGGCAPRRAFCEADVPEGARSDPSGLGAEMRPPERNGGISLPAGSDQGRCPWTLQSFEKD